MSWDEALDRAAAELDRIRKQHGNPAIFGGSYGWASAGRFHHARTLLHRFLNTIGGFTGQTTNYSYGAAMAFLPRIVGASESIVAPATSLSTVADNADLLVAFGCVPFKNWEMHDPIEIQSVEHQALRGTAKQVIASLSWIFAPEKRPPVSSATLH